MCKSASKVRTGNTWSAWGLSACLVLGLFWVYAGTAVSSDLPESEYNQKAEYLYHFVRFSTWPTESFSNANELSRTTEKQQFIVGVLGEDPFGVALDQLVGKIVKGRSIVITRFTDSGTSCVFPERTNHTDCPDDFTDSQMLFISRSERDNIGLIRARLKGRSVMTVSDMEKFTESGGMIGFYTVNGELRFQINPNVARDANIQFDLELASLGEIVPTVSDSLPDPTRIAILPPREVDEMLSGIGKGMLASLELRNEFVVSNAAESLNLKASVSERLWMPAYKNVHAEPNLEAIKNVAQRMNVKAVLMYSTHNIRDLHFSKIRITLVDVVSDKVYQADVPGVVAASIVDFLNPDMSIPVARVTDKLLDDFFEGLTLVRVVVLSGSKGTIGPIARNLTGIERGFFLALESHKSVTVTHTSDPNLAQEYRLDRLELDASLGKSIWSTSHRNDHVVPNIEAIKDAVHGISTRLVLTYSVFEASHLNLRIFLIDLETNQVQQADIPTAVLWGASDASWYVEYATNELLRNVRGMQNESTASALP